MTLRPVSRQLSFPDYAVQLWSRRHFIYADSKNRAFAGNRDLLLGNIWLIGVPLLQGLVYYVIFGLVLGTDRGVENFTGFLVIGIFLFRFTTASLTRGVGAMSAHRGMMSSFAFPRAAIPIAVALRETLSMLPVLATMFLLLLTLPPGTSITETWLYFPVIFALQVVFNAGLTFYSSRLGHAIPDFRHIMPFVARFWFYTSGVFFSIERFVKDGIWLSVFQGNPLYIVLDMSRDLLLYDRVPESNSWLLLTAWSLTTLSLGFWYFWKGERTYAAR